MMKLTLINVGYGEAILAECRDDAFAGGVFTLLIDGGSAEQAEYAGNTTGRTPVTRFLRQRGIDHIHLMISSHIHEDHLCGLVPVTADILPERYGQSLPVDFWQRMRPLSPSLATTRSMRKQICALNDYYSLCRHLTDRGTTLSTLTASPHRIPLCRHLTMEVLAPSAAQVGELQEQLDMVYNAPNDEACRAALTAVDRAMNNYSLILLLEYEGVRILLPGDTNRDGYAGLEGQIGADLFKVGHHSQLDGISPALFEAIRPDYVVSCASSDRRFGSAHPDILKMMGEKGARLFFSDCPDLPPYTDGLRPHQGICFEISGGRVTPRYLDCDPPET